MSSSEPVPEPEPGRRSACAEASREAQLERVRAMTALERMALALALGRRCRDMAELAGKRAPAP